MNDKPNKFLLIGGPEQWDGKRLYMENGENQIHVPVHAPISTLGLMSTQGSPNECCFEAHTYSKTRLVFDREPYTVFTHSSVKTNQIFSILMENYKEPNQTNE